jgi:hypothetical protein
MSKETLFALNVKEELINPTLSYSMYGDDSKVYGCAGFHEMWPGVCEAWLHAKEYKHFHSNMFMIIWYIRGAIKVLHVSGFYRIQAAIKADELKSRKLVEVLGFKYEGLMKKYGPDKSDFIMYAKVK